MEKRLHWSVTVAGGCEQAVTHPELLRIVLRNLIENAIQFTAADGHLEVRVDRDGRDIALTVIDDGCGIAPEEQQRVFERFYQVGRARSGPGRGTGLGLSIVRHAVAAMEGTIDLQSVVGRGTQVTVRIPDRGKRLTEN
jgi:two-component system phosphate regulon sensor histidine kinase PhoR